MRLNFRVLIPKISEPIYVTSGSCIFIVLQTQETGNDLGY